SWFHPAFDDVGCGLGASLELFLFQFSGATLLGRVPPCNDFWDGNRQLPRLARLINHCTTDVMPGRDRHSEEPRMHPSSHALAADRRHRVPVFTAALAALIVLA